MGVVVGHDWRGFRGREEPNGPQSLRLAPGGFYASWLAEYGFVRGEPVPIERALKAERSQDGEARLSPSAAQAGCRSKRPARWHGLAPSLGGVMAGRVGCSTLRLWVAGKSVGFRGREEPNGPDARPLGCFVCDPVGTFGGEQSVGFRGREEPNGPDARPLGCFVCDPVGTFGGEQSVGLPEAGRAQRPGRKTVGLFCVRPCGDFWW